MERNRGENGNHARGVLKSHVNNNREKKQMYSNKENINQYNINKVYVMINELQNAVTLKDKEVFLIKYKNLLEELQNI